MKTIDMLGQPCPIPVIQAKKAMAGGEGLVAVLVDNIVAVQNLRKMAEGLGYSFEHSQPAEERFEVRIGRPEADAGSGLPSREAATQRQPEASDIQQQGKGVTVLITADHMGRGSEELGRILIKGYIFSLTQLEPLPRAVLFINSGVKLTTAGANTIEDLQTLAGQGVDICSCGTCLNYYGLTDKLEVGEVVDMYAISTALAGGAGVITI